MHEFGWWGKLEECDLYAMSLVKTQALLHHHAAPQDSQVFSSP